MASANTFRVFVSSTFDDLVEERNRLQSEVFPELRRRCEERGYRFQAIDLRWGVPLEAGFDQRTMEICLGEIEHCREISPRPNFVVLLGDRYGWRPLPARIPEDEFARIRSGTPEGVDCELLEAWYPRDENAVPPEHYLRPREQKRFREAGVWGPIEADLRRIVDAAVAGTELECDLRYAGSATEQEIEAGALSVEDAPEHVFCFFRTIEGLPKDASGKPYVDLDGADAVVSEAHERLETLKGRLRRRLPGNCFDYEETWNGSGPTHERLDDLAHEVRERLWQVIEAEIEGRRVDEPEAMVAAHERFARERAAHFTGRAEVLEQIAAYLEAPEGRPLALWGEPGTGKSAVVAQAFLQAADANLGAEIVARFVGATADSSDGRSLLDGLCRDISRRYGETAAVPSTYRELVEELPKRLALASEERPLMVFIDAVNQLSEAEHARSLAWLPATLPDHVAVVVSTATEPAESLRALTAKLPDDHRIELEPMPEADGARLLDLWLDAAKPQRRLQPAQQEEVLSRFGKEGLPLYLKLAFEEARRWRSDEHARLAPGIQGVIRENLFRRLEHPKQHGQLLVERALGYLAAGKNGLAEDELLDVLAADEEFWADFVAKSAHPLPQRRLPVSVWSRLYFDLKPYLADRSADGTMLLGFYHPQLAAAAQVAYLEADEGLERHRSLAAYFHRQWDEGRRTGNRRLLSELPYQQTTGELWDDVFDTLTDFDFLERKATNAGVVESTDEHGVPTRTYTGVFQLEQDYALALQRMPGADTAGARALIVTATDLGRGLEIHCPWCNRYSPLQEEWLGKEITCPQESCGKPLNVNSFTVPAEARRR
jgi:NACHT domain- and WD repeat-containing protein